MGILAGNWENWRIKGKDGKTIPTIVYVVRRDKGRMVTWTKQENLDKLNDLIYQYSDEGQELPEGLFYEYHMTSDITPNPQQKEDYDDIISIRFSSKTKIPSNRIMGRIFQEVNKLPVTRDNAGYKEGAKNILQNFNWTTLKSKNNFKLLRDINFGITTRPTSTQVTFKGKRL